MNNYSTKNKKSQQMINMYENSNNYILFFSLQYFTVYFLCIFFFFEKKINKILQEFLFLLKGNL